MEVNTNKAQKNKSREGFVLTDYVLTVYISRKNILKLANKLLGKICR